MSFDLPDYIGASGEYANLVASGVANNGVTNVNVPMSATDRSLVILLNTAGAVGTIGVTGNVTGIQYPSNATTTSIATGIFTFPVYGAVDNSVTVSLAVNLPGGVQYWIIATPDVELDGLPSSPFYVVNPPLTPITANPVARDGGGGATVVLSATNGQLIAAPPPGWRNVIDTLSLVNTTSTAGDIVLRSGSNVGQVLFWDHQAAGAQNGWPLHAPIYGKDGTAIWCSSSGTGSLRLTAAYHSEWTGL